MGRPVPQRHPPAIQSARDFLHRTLSVDPLKGMTWSELTTAGLDAGYSESTLRRARKLVARSFAVGLPLQLRWYLNEDQYGRWLSEAEHRKLVRGRR